MNLCIIIHSKTGTTLGLGELIAEHLKKDNHKVDLIKLETDVPVTSGSVRKPARFKILNVPDCSKYDAVLVGAPVWAFSASPVIIACMKELRGVSGKKLLPFVTMGFPLKFMGGAQAVSLMTATAQKKGAQVLTGIIVRKMFHNLNSQMEQAASVIRSYFK